MTNEDGSRKWLDANLGPRDVARFIADTLRDLAPLARRIDSRDLAYLLDLALAEAEHVTKLPEERRDRGRAS